MPTVKDEDRSGVLRAAARVVRKESKANKEARRLKIPVGVFSDFIRKFRKTADAALGHRPKPHV